MQTDGSSLEPVLGPLLEPIAIIGMACLFPQAPDLQSFWANILHGVDAVGEPVAAWDADRYLQSGRIKTPFGGYLNDLYRFDPREFGIMPNSLDGGEPDQFLALRVARDALLDAGYPGNEFDHTDTGIILGHSTYLHRGQVTVIQNNIVLDQTLELLKAAIPSLDAAAIEPIRQMLKAKLPPTNSDTAPGLVPNVMTGRIANRLNLKGPNYLIDAACSSSLLAVSAAIDELRAGRSRMMLAGGVNASLPADVSTIFTQLGALSARGKVRPFESGSDGTLLGEGLGVIALKRLSDALADGDKIYATVRGVGQASDGRATGLLAPSVDGETLSIRRAYDRCGVDPASVSLIEAHGTGIPLGDKTEIAALKNVFGARVGMQGTVALGSVKSMISHCIPAAGIAGLIKTSLALHHRILPPTLCETVNADLGIEQTPFYINTQAAPWISPLGVPRRAGVDSFGFGGINTHAVVEQAPAAAQRPRLMSPWLYELCIFSADSAADLIAALDRLRAGLELNPDWRLDEIAAALAAADGQHRYRLALVVKNKAALAKTLDTACGKLQENPDTAWSTRAGSFYGPRRVEGQLAFMFPGEGSQYLGMFADLALCFDEVRHWLDFWRGLYPDTPGANRTDVVYPPAIELTPERRSQLEARLHGMDVGSEAVMVGGQAMYSLLKSLGVHPDVMVGHSSGESSALAASGALPAENPAQLAAFIRELNVVYQQVLDAGQIATGALLAVGALSASVVHAQIDASGLDIVVAMDNCANQLVLYGNADSTQKLQLLLTRAGGICLPLPFDRGYHTPAFAAVTTAFRSFYESARITEPKVPLYSCASAERFPAEESTVRDLAAAQWSTTVRFRETIARMHADGVRYFVEVGPSANLTAFIGDILPTHEHVALATNQRRKHGLEQLLTVLAQLFVHGKPVDVGRLFGSRAIRRIDLDATQRVASKGLLLDNTLPMLRLTAADRVLLQQLTGAATSTPFTVHTPSPVVPVAMPVPAAPSSTAAGTARAGEPDTNLDTADEIGVEHDPREAVMAGYFDLMRGFLAQQHDLMSRWPVTESPVPEPAVTKPAMAAALNAPFLNSIVEHDALHLLAACDLSLHHHQFLRDHVLSGRGSATDPELLGLSCVPLMVSLEIMAEACALLAGTTQVCSIENVRAFDWIALDDDEVSLDVRADVVDVGAGLYAAALYHGEALTVSAQFRFVADFRLQPVDALETLRKPRWNGQEIYVAGMFHGPLFQSLEHIHGWDDGGIDARLTPVALAGFLDSEVAPDLVLNPVLLDAMGQLAACWTAEFAGTDFNCFPSTIARIELYQPCPADVPGLELRARQRLLDSDIASDIASPRAWSFECTKANGRPLVRVENLVNVFFTVPNRFYQARRDPLNGWLGRPLELAVVSGVAVWELELLPEEFCAQSNAIFLRMLAHSILSFEERSEWRGLKKNVRQRRQWLLGRLALKESVRHWILAHSGELLYPSDIVVFHDEHGAPAVDGWWNGSLSEAPAVSLSHNDRTCVAAVSVPGFPVGVDIEDIGKMKRPELLIEALSNTEQDRLPCLGGTQPDVLLRMWCAKEAAAKLLGLGLQGLPTAFEVSFTDSTLSYALVHHNDMTIEVSIAVHGLSILAIAATIQSGIKVY